MKLNLVEGRDTINLKFIDNQEFIDYIKNTCGVTIIPTIDENSFDPRDTQTQVRMKKHKFGTYDEVIFNSLNINNGEEPLDKIFYEMFLKFKELNDIKSGDILVSYGIFSIGPLIDPETLDMVHTFYLRGLINDPINVAYSVVIKAQEDLELLKSAGV